MVVHESDAVGNDDDNLADNFSTDSMLGSTKLGDISVRINSWLKASSFVGGKQNRKLNYDTPDEYLSQGERSRKSNEIGIRDCGTRNWNPPELNKPALLFGEKF